ncbi:hypothetical protein BDV96DRAFT_150188 [Lophiotrema nucula]|uniref:Uncharacterized protein n=1 Tax=Lophiotrema nucula TaxID=690887 RepID=A0A6A5Z220_9PLEO|nr:hypothetical protein BDV96DRAFT_150188 [Lophiotrema nucula]
MTATPVITALPLNATASITNLPIVGDGTYIDESGFTFVSPSVYIAFTSLGGHNSCGLLGEPIYNTTIGFHRNEISSLVSPEPFTVCTTTHKQLVKSYTWEWTDTDTSTTTVYTILTQKVEYTDVAQDCSSIPGYSFFADNPQNWQIALGGMLLLQSPFTLFFIHTLIASCRSLSPCHRNSRAREESTPGMGIMRRARSTRRFL